VSCPDTTDEDAIDQADPALSVSCPTCRAVAGAECTTRTRTGRRHTVTSHLHRRLLAAGECLTCEGRGLLYLTDLDATDCYVCTGRSS